MPKRSLRSAARLIEQTPAEEMLPLREEGRKVEKWKKWKKWKSKF